MSLAAGTLSVASAADEKKANPQQERMKACNAEEGDKKGDERKAFMSQCLKGGAAKPMTQQEKMKKCNVDASAKAFKGDDRKAFMSDCLKADKKMKRAPVACVGSPRLAVNRPGPPRQAVRLGASA